MADGIGQLLLLARVLDGNEHVVQHGVADVLLVQFPGQLVVCVEIRLQAERRPGRDAQVTQAEAGQDKAEVVMQALAGHGLKRGLMSCFVAPGLEGRARFHAREDVGQSRRIAPLLHDGPNSLFLAEVFLLDEFGLQPVLLGHRFSMVS